MHMAYEKLSDKLSQGPCINTLSKDCWDFIFYYEEIKWKDQKQQLITFYKCCLYSLSDVAHASSASLSLIPIQNTCSHVIASNWRLNEQGQYSKSGKLSCVTFSFIKHW